MVSNNRNGNMRKNNTFIHSAVHSLHTCECVCFSLDLSANDEINTRGKSASFDLSICYLFFLHLSKKKSEKNLQIDTQIHRVVDDFIYKMMLKE